MKTKLDKRNVFIVSHNYDTKRSTFRAEGDFLSQLALTFCLPIWIMEIYIDTFLIKATFSSFFLFYWRKWASIEFIGPR